MNFEPWQFVALLVAVAMVCYVLNRPSMPTLREKLQIHLATAKENHLTHAMDAAHHFALAKLYRDRVDWLQGLLEQENEYGTAQISNGQRADHPVVASGVDMQATHHAHFDP